MKQNNVVATTKLMKKVGVQLLQWWQDADLLSYTYKRGKEVVSTIDKKAEIAIRQGIKKILPHHKIWGEELGRDRGNLKREKFIIIDPIDGSKNFLSGNPLFASQIACIERGKIIWSIVNLPALGELYYAVAGKGAFCNGARIHPSAQHSLDLALQCFGIGHDAQNFLRLPRLIAKHLAEPRHYGCSGVHLTFVACGRTDINIAVEAAFYDLAPGLLICKESGLSFATLDGSPYRFGENSLSVVIGNKAILQEFRNAVRRGNRR